MDIESGDITVPVTAKRVRLSSVCFQISFCQIISFRHELFFTRHVLLSGLLHGNHLCSVFITDERFFLSSLTLVEQAKDDVTTYILWCRIDLRIVCHCITHGTPPKALQLISSQKQLHCFMCYGERSVHQVNHFNWVNIEHYGQPKAINFRPCTGSTFISPGVAKLWCISACQAALF